MRGKFKLIPLVIAAIVILFQFMGAEKFTNPETGKKTRVALSSKDEKALGMQSFQEVLATADVLETGPEVDMVRRVAERLAPVTGEAARDFEWVVSVVKSPQVNAFCLPGGKIVVYTGILPIAQTEEGLATVMGHEMAHAVARHGSQRLFQHSLMQTAMVGASFSLGDFDPQQRHMILGLLGAGAQYGVLMPFGRDHESEADHMGLLYMARAGYNPEAAIGFWERMAEAGSANQPPEFMSTHPAHGTRIARIRELMPKALAEYEKRRQNRNLSAE
ncbi:MAG: M48 family metallopeptidase [Verrucomicrobiota bacterium]|nr:M48 family metallopeptidase [Verrucomicrobiota bacterium]